MKIGFFTKMETTDPATFQQLKTWIDQNCTGCQYANAIDNIFKHEGFCEFAPLNNMGKHESLLRVAHRYLKNIALCPCSVKDLEIKT